MSPRISYVQPATVKDEKMLAEFGDLNKKIGDLSKKAEND